MSRIEELMNLPDSVNPEQLETMAAQERAVEIHAERIQALALQKLAGELTKGVQTEKQNEHISQQKRRRKFSRVLIALAACALICSIGTAGFAALSTDTRLLEVLHADSQSQIEKLNQMQTVLNQSEQADGYIVTLKEVISDRHNFWLLLKLEGPADVILNENTILFENTNIQMEKVSGHGYALYPLPDENPADNQLDLVLDFSSRNRLAGQKFKMEFKNLIRNVLDEDLRIIGTELLARGPWVFEIEIPAEDSTVSVWQWKPVIFEENRFLIQKIEVSPLSLSIDAMKLNQRTYMRIKEEKPQIWLKDGTKLVMDGNGSGSSGGAWMQYQYTFPYPADLKQIDRIVFCGEELIW